MSTEQCLSVVNHTIKGEGELFTKETDIDRLEVYASERMQ